VGFNFFSRIFGVRLYRCYTVKKLLFYGFLEIAQFDANFQFISRITAVATAHATTLASNCYYVRLNYQHKNGNYLGLRRMNLGITLLAHENYELSLESVKVEIDPITPDATTF